MKRLLFSVVLGASLLFIPFGSFAVSGEVKIAYVDLQEALNSSDAGKRLRISSRLK